MVTNWHKMRGSERCDECGSRRWYAGDDQLRYCENGHRLEGFATTDVGEDDYTMTGRVTKKKKERRKREALKLEGPAAKKLYLQALQHVLRLQVDWVKKEGLKLDTTEGVTYEGLTKELWGLVCLLPGVMDDQAGEDSGTDAVASSSEPEASEAESTTTNGWLDRDGTNKLPNHTHTLALCYIAAVILKQPVTTADFHGWAQTGDVEYLAVLHRVPQNVKARLPAKYHRGLQIRDHIKPGKLLHTVQELAMALDIHFQVKLPTLNYTEILVRHILELTLPVEVYLMVKCLAEILDYGFEFPDGTSRRVRTMDNPEVLLVTLVVVAAKFIYSLDGVDRPPIDHEDPRVKQINWTEWETAMAKKGKRSPSTDGLERGKEYRTTQNEALMYNENKIDDFMDWYEKMWIDEDVEPKSKCLPLLCYFTFGCPYVFLDLSTWTSRVARLD